MWEAAPGLVERAGDIARRRPLNEGPN